MNNYLHSDEAKAYLAEKEKSKNSFLTDLAVEARYGAISLANNTAAVYSTDPETALKTMLQDKEYFQNKLNGDCGDKCAFYQKNLNEINDLIPGVKENVEIKGVITQVIKDNPSSTRFVGAVAGATVAIGSAAIDGALVAGDSMGKITQPFAYQPVSPLFQSIDAVGGYKTFSNMGTAIIETPDRIKNAAEQNDAFTFGYEAMNGYLLGRAAFEAGSAGVGVIRRPAGVESTTIVAGDAVATTGTANAEVYVSGVANSGTKVAGAVDVTTVNATVSEKLITIDSKGNALVGDWSTTKILSAPENASVHWSKHGVEFSEYTNASQYAEGAQNFVSNPPSGILTKTRPNGDVMFYDTATNTFAVKTSTGEPRTMFRPTDGINYWNKQ